MSQRSYWTVLGLAAWVATAGAAQAQVPIVATYHGGAATAGAEGYEYRIERFHETNHRNLEEFEEALDDLGAGGWFSIAHFPDLNPANHMRLFMRRIGGPVLVVDYAIDEYPLPLVGAGANRWVDEYDRLGEQGKFPIWFFSQGGRNYVVSEIRREDGELLTLSWEAVRAGRRGSVGPRLYKKAARALAEESYVPTTIGFSADQVDYFVVGIAETTEGKEIEVELKFGKAKLSTPPQKWKKLATRKAKKGYRLAAVELSDSTGTNFILTFARSLTNDEKITRRTCAVEPIRLGDMAQMVANLNALGAQGFEEIIVTFAGSFTDFQFVLCRDK